MNVFAITVYQSIANLTLLGLHLTLIHLQWPILSYLGQRLSSHNQDGPKYSGLYLWLQGGRAKDRRGALFWTATILTLKFSSFPSQQSVQCWKAWLVCDTYPLFSFYWPELSVIPWSCREDFGKVVSSWTSIYPVKIRRLLKKLLLKKLSIDICDN